MRHTIRVLGREAGERLDKVLSLHVDSRSRTFLNRLVREGCVSVNGETALKPGIPVAEDDVIEVELPEETLPESAEPADIPLDILYEDDDLMVINKPKGMVVHPAAGHKNDTLVNAVLFHAGDSLSGIGGVLRPGIVHRIDKDTTGALLVCKNDAAHLSLSAQLKAHSIERVYTAIVYGLIAADDGTVDKPIARSTRDRKKMTVALPGKGKRAVTHYHVEERYQRDGLTLITCRLETGRTHQIRVHMASIGHPVLGDQVYGPAKNPYHLEGQTLHAMVLGFRHPRTGEYMEFTAPLPAYFSKLLETFTKQE